MAQSRNHERPSFYPRGERCVKQGDQWYVATREHIDVGPYRTQERAESAARELSQRLAHIQNHYLALMFIRGFMPRMWRGG